jgi:cell division protein WhiA
VVKSGATIGELLTTMGATGAFLAWDERRLRRQLRSDATRLANADAANLRRTIDAAAMQVRAVETVVAELGWEALDEPLRAVALARLANPEASLSELGELVDPPVAKSVVHRRLRRLEELAAGP